MVSDCMVPEVPGLRSNIHAESSFLGKFTKLPSIGSMADAVMGKTPPHMVISQKWANCQQCTAKKFANEEKFVLNRLKSVAAQCKVSDEMMKNAPGKFIQCMDNELRKRSENFHDIGGNPTSTPTGPTGAGASPDASSSQRPTTSAGLPKKGSDMSDRALISLIRVEDRRKALHAFL